MSLSESQIRSMFTEACAELSRLDCNASVARMRALQIASIAEKRGIGSWRNRILDAEYVRLEHVIRRTLYGKRQINNALLQKAKL